jgi:hypothetical protein
MLFRKDGYNILRHQRNLIILNQKESNFEQATLIAREMKDISSNYFKEDQYPELL